MPKLRRGLSIRVSLVKLWRIGAGGQHPPADYLIEQAKSLVNDKDIELDEKNRTIAFLEQTPDVEGMFIMEDNKVYVTSGLHGKMKLTSSQYTLVDGN